MSGFIAVSSGVFFDWILIPCPLLSHVLSLYILLV